MLPCFTLSKILWPPYWIFKKMKTVKKFKIFDSEVKKKKRLQVLTLLIAFTCYCSRNIPKHHKTAINYMYGSCCCCCCFCFCFFHVVFSTRSHRNDWASIISQKCLLFCFHGGVFTCFHVFHVFYSFLLPSALFQQQFIYLFLFSWLLLFA